jgi:hypothetical protein
MKKIMLSAIATAFIFSGCSTPYSEAPLPINYKTTEQHKLQAALHWKMIANDLAKSVAEKNGVSKTVYVNKFSEKFHFNQAFHTLLISALVNKGMHVMKTAENADVSVDITIQMIKFSKNRAPYRDSVGIPTFLTAGLWVLRDFMMNHSATSSAILTTATVAVGMDTYNWFKSKYPEGEIPQNEIIVTVSSSEQNQYVSSLSNVYYTSDTDQSLYTSMMQGKNLLVEGGN